MTFNGLYINLDSAQTRQQALQDHFADVGVDPRQYHRFAAIRPSGSEPELGRGLRNVGELGIWRSIVASLEMVAVGNFEEFVHVMEDDERLQPGATGFLQAARQLFAHTPALARVDLLFVGYFITRDLAQTILELRRHATDGPTPLTLLPGSAYVASMSSFLVRRSSALRVAQALREVLHFARPLVPVDIALRDLIGRGAVRAALLAPPGSAPSWSEDAHSSIQTGLPEAVRQSHRAYLLLRLLAAGQQSPRWCADRLASIYGINHPLGDRATPMEFLQFFDRQAHRLAAF